MLFFSGLGHKTHSLELLLTPQEGFLGFQNYHTYKRKLGEPVCTSDESSESKSKDVGSIELDRSFID